MNSEEGNPFKSSRLGREFRNHNARISINESVSSNPNIKVHWIRGKQLHKSLSIFLKGLPWCATFN